MREYIEANASTGIAESDYNGRYDELSDRYESTKRAMEIVASQLSETRARAECLRAFMSEVSQRDRLLSEFDEQLWYATVDTVTVEARDRLVFRFKNGSEIKVKVLTQLIVACKNAPSGSPVHFHMIVK